MLVLTRFKGDEIVIGDPKKPIGSLRITAILGDRVRIAFDFPREIPVHRREVASKIATESKPLEGLRSAKAKP